MAEKTFNQAFDGYWRAKNSNGLPHYSGVYVVQSCTHNQNEDSVSLNKLLYIGKADDINNRINNHEKLEIWKAQLGYKEELCFSCTQVSVSENERVEAALINANQPIVNTTYKKSFPFDKTNINSSGNYNNLIENITVKRH